MQLQLNWIATLLDLRDHKITQAENPFCQSSSYVFVAKPQLFWTLVWGTTCRCGGHGLGVTTAREATVRSKTTRQLLKRLDAAIDYIIISEPESISWCWRLFLMGKMLALFSRLASAKAPLQEVVRWSDWSFPKFPRMTFQKVLCTNPSGEFQVPDICGTRRSNNQYIQEVILCSFPKNQSQIPSQNVLGATKQISKDWHPGFRKQYLMVGGWPLVISRLEHHPTWSCGYFEVWDIRGPGWGNGCSHPAFQKNGRRWEMYAAYTLWEEWFIYCAESLLWHNRHHKNNNSVGLMSPKGLKKESTQIF